MRTTIGTLVVAAVVATTIMAHGQDYTFEKIPLNDTNIAQLTNAVKTTVDAETNRTTTVVGELVDVQADNFTVKDHMIVGPNNTSISLRPNILGDNIQVGSKAWYYRAIVFSTNVVGKPATIYLTDIASERNDKTTSTNTTFQSGYVVGDILSMVNKSKYYNFGSVIAVNGNVVDVDSIPFTDIVDGETDYDDYTVSSTNKPTVGVLSIGDYSFAMGAGHRVYRRLGSAFGRDNIIIGDYGMAEGRNNVSGYAAHAEGHLT